ncbi:MAG: hypothetical protein LBL74_08560 [Bacteroidales bacterium]|jgi:hypothetical protein|nr:hypothetical protein [Bacteroidales bacterium]
MNKILLHNMLTKQPFIFTKRRNIFMKGCFIFPKQPLIKTNESNAKLIPAQGQLKRTFVFCK